MQTTHDIRQIRRQMPLVPLPVYDHLLDTIGATPLVSLRRLLPEAPFEIYAKLEGFNPGGSMKDRVAIQMLREAIQNGDLRSGDTVIESSSGNLGIGLAQACAYLGLRFICVVDPRITNQNLMLIQAYGAQVEMVSEPDPITRDFLQARINRVKQLCATVPNSFWCNQYANVNNPLAHQQTMHEIATALEGQVDYLLCATSTCGTLRGCAEYIRLHDMPTQVIAVDAVGSAIFGGPPCKRLIPGHGAGFRSALYQDDLADRYVQINDLECVMGCRHLVATEAILAGGSSGALVAALQKIQDTIKPGTVCVLVLADRGERYLDTIYSDEWVQQNLQAVPRRTR